jgi:uncharacterized protein with ParB-like and HNH nuclease domain
MGTSTSINATEDTVNSLLSRNYRFIVPEYQRQYSWTEEQWNEFWDDLTDLDDQKTHFLGSIVVVEKDTAIDELDRFEVVDGQQRLTTISVLLCTIRQHYDLDGREEAADSVANDYIWEEDDDFNPQQKLTLNSLDNQQYRRLLHGNSPREDESRLKGVSSFFADKLSDLSGDEVDHIRKRLLNAMTLVTIECDSQESAFRLFETLNDRGLELSSVDLIKNYLYKKATQDPSINEEAIKRDWETVIENIRYDLDKPYRFFIHYFLYAAEPDLTHNISQNTLYDNFKQLVENHMVDSDIGLEEYISNMADESVLYLNITNSNIDKYDTSSNNKINDILSDLSRLGFSQERLYMMGVFSNIDNATEAIRSLKLIESFMIRQRFTGKITGKDLNELYSDLCSEAFERDDPVGYIRSQLSDRAPDDDEMKAALKTHNFSRSARTLFFLERLESEYYRMNSPTPSRRGEIEHIIPRKAFTAKKYNNWPSYLDMGQEEFNQTKDRIGNLTILEKRLNLEARDKPFEQKKDKYQASDYEMAQSITDYDRWSADVISSRTEELVDAATRIWDFDV